MSHFDEMTCLLYLEGQLDRPRALELSAHVESCAGCRALLRALERESQLLSQALQEQEEAIPARLLAPSARETTPWAWIVSFGLAGAGVYALWTGIIEPGRRQLSEAGFGASNLLTTLLFSGVFWKGWGTMANLLLSLAAMTLGILAIALLRRSWRRWTTLTVVVGALLCALLLPQPAGAAELKKGQVYTLGKDEIIHNDLIVTGASVRIDGTVEGDLIAFGRRITVSGHVTGDVLAFAQVASIGGQVDGNVRAFSNTLSLEGTVGKNVTAFAANTDLDSRASVGGGMMVFSGEGMLDGQIHRDLMAYVGRLLLNGSVGGSAIMRSDRLTIGPTAAIAGKASYRGPRQPDVSPQAKLATPLEIKIVMRRPSYESGRFYLRQALFWGAAFLFGLVLLLLLPNLFNEVVRASREYVFSPLLGIAAVVGVPFLAIVVSATVVGLAVGIGSLLVWIMALYASQTFVGAWLGGRLLGQPGSTAAIIGRMALGLFVLRVLFALPYAGGWIKFIVVIWGLGALTLALFRRTQAKLISTAAAG